MLLGGPCCTLALMRLRRNNCFRKANAKKLRMTQNKKHRRELDWLMWGCPLQGKCGVEATCAWLSKRVWLAWVDPKLPTPTNAP